MQRRSRRFRTKGSTQTYLDNDTRSTGCTQGGIVQDVAKLPVAGPQVLHQIALACESNLRLAVAPQAAQAWHVRGPVHSLVTAGVVNIRQTAASILTAR
jgi:hypothetical protein